MENKIANQIIKEHDIIAKMEIIYVLSNNMQFTFEKSAILKTLIARYFIKCMNIDVDENIILTSQLLSCCKKGENPQVCGRVKTFAIDSANYLFLLGFDKKICKLVEQVNRYNPTGKRYLESDILELADQYGGLLIDRAERIGFQPDEAMVLLEYRNLKSYNNQFKNLFKVFVDQIENIDVKDHFKYSILNQMVYLYRQSNSVRDYIINISKNYINEVDLLTDDIKKSNSQIIYDINNPKRSMFNEETTFKYIQSANSKDVKSNK